MRSDISVIPNKRSYKDHQAIPSVEVTGGHDVAVSAHRVRARVREQLVLNPAVTGLLSSGFRTVGARSVAAILRQLSTELVHVDLPSTARGDGAGSIRMLSRGGRDQIAMQLQAGGWSAFEWPMPSVFAACVATFPGLTLDVGANTGFYSVVAIAVDANARVIAFEPFAPVARDLRSTLHLNRCEERVTVVEAAVSDEIGEAKLFVPLQDHGLIETSATLSGDFKEAYSETLAVPVTTFDAYDEANASGPVAVIKIDVESFEAQVLYGASRVIGRDRPVIFCEVLPQGDAARIDAFRAAHDYVDMRLHDHDVVIEDRVRFDDRGWNHALVPAEKVPAMVDLLLRIGLGTHHA